MKKLKAAQAEQTKEASRFVVADYSVCLDDLQREVADLKEASKCCQTEVRRARGATAQEREEAF